MYHVQFVSSASTLLCSFDPLRKKHAKATGAAKEKLERKRLQALQKKELRGAVRELRRDAQFVAKHRLDEQLQKSVSQSQNRRLYVMKYWLMFCSCDFQGFESKAKSERNYGTVIQSTGRVELACKN